MTFRKHGYFLAVCDVRLSPAREVRPFLPLPCLHDASEVFFLGAKKGNATIRDKIDFSRGSTIIFPRESSCEGEKFLSEQCALGSR